MLTDNERKELNILSSKLGRRRKIVDKLSMWSPAVRKKILSKYKISEQDSIDVILDSSSLLYDVDINYITRKDFVDCCEKIIKTFY